MQLSEDDDLNFLELLHQHVVDSHKLKTILDLNVNLFQLVLDEYDRTGKRPAPL